MKTITIDDDGNVTIDGELSHNDKIVLGGMLYSQQDKDLDGQILFYTGLYYSDEDGYHELEFDDDDMYA